MTIMVVSMWVVSPRSGGMVEVDPDEYMPFLSGRHAEVVYGDDPPREGKVVCLRCGGPLTLHTDFSSGRFACSIACEVCDEAD
jgi:hypothetical protein